MDMWDRANNVFQCVKDRT